MVWLRICSTPCLPWKKNWVKPQFTMVQSAPCRPSAGGVFFGVLDNFHLETLQQRRIYPNVQSDQKACPMHRIVKHCHGVAETMALGRTLGQGVPAGTVICLQGEMGAGKTHFVKGLAEGLGVAEQDHVISPTYDLVHEHGDPCRLVHIDLYRIAVPGAEDVEWLLGYLNEADTIKAIEWPERISDVMPQEALTIDIAFGADEGDRIITLSAAQPFAFDL